MKTQAIALNTQAMNLELQINNRKGENGHAPPNRQAENQGDPSPCREQPSAFRGLLLALLFVLATLSYATAQQSGSETFSQSRTESNQGPIGIVPMKGAEPPIADVGGGQDSPSGNGIEYHGGPVMVSPHNVYYIWYGNWSGNTATTILPNFMSGLNGSPYFNIDTSYTQSTGQSVVNTVTMSSQVFDNYSLGSNLSDSEIQAVVNSKITSGQLPADSNGIYFVLTSSDVTESGSNGSFCTNYCGWHTHANLSSTDIKYGFVGDPATQCNSTHSLSCSIQSNTPNGNEGADAMASTMAHELNETVTDPDLNVWYHLNLANEVGDLCAWNFGSTFTAPNGSLANVTLGGYYYLIQQNWLNAGGGSCALSFAGRLTGGVDQIIRACFKNTSGA
jgi:Phosphate-induced protein 1 conserved region